MTKAKASQGAQRGKGSNATRPIKTKRDLDGARGVVKKISKQNPRDTAAELRLQSLLKEMDRFEEINDDADDDTADVSGYPGPHRRWSDDGGEDRSC